MLSKVKANGKVIATSGSIGKKGFATFQTIYPGHYMGRATHIHLKVHIAAKAKAP